MKPSDNLDITKVISQRETTLGYWIFILFFGALLSSQSAMDLFATLMFVTSVMWTIRHQKISRQWPRIGLLPVLLFWFFVILLGTTLNPVVGSKLSLISEFKWIIHLYVLTFFFSIYGEPKKTLWIFSIALTICSALALVIYFLGFNPITENLATRAQNLNNFGGYRANGLFGRAMPLAHSYGPILMVFLGYCFFKMDHWKSISKWVYTAIILTALTLTFTYTRGVWIGFAAGFIAITFMLNRKVGLYALASLLVFSTITFFASEKIRNRVMVTVNMTNQGDHERITLWKANWEIVKDHPIIGIGYSQNVTRLREYYDRLKVPTGYFESHAHNTYLHFLAGTGILGLSCYLILLFYALRAATFSFKNSVSDADKGVALGIIGGLICFIVGSLTESNFSISKNRYMMIFLMAWAFYLQLKAKKTITQNAQ